MKSVKFFGLLFFFFITTSAYAQFSSIAPQVEHTVLQQTLAPRGVVALSRQANEQLYRQLTAFFKPSTASFRFLRHRLPPSNIPTAFQVHHAGNPDSTASAFAIEINGRVFGVTAGHVMRNIADMEGRRALAERRAQGIYEDLEYLNPQMRVRTPDGSFISYDISSWRLSNPKGSDVAVFEIPSQARAYVQPLPIATQRAQPRQIASIAGFAYDKPLWFRAEEVLFATPHRLLLRKSSTGKVDGMCGSPVMINGEVAGLYVGAYLKDEMPLFLWNMPKEFYFKKFPNMHYAAPIENIFPLIDELTGSQELHAVTMRVFDHPIAQLRPEDQLYSIKLFRNGKMKQLTHADLLTDPEHLENLFELQENDVLRITVEPHTYTTQKDKVIEYNINVSSGEVVRNIPQDATPHKISMP